MHVHIYNKTVFVIFNENNKSDESTGKRLPDRKRNDLTTMIAINEAVAKSLERANRVIEKVINNIREREGVQGKKTMMRIKIKRKAKQKG